MKKTFLIILLLNAFSISNCAEVSLWFGNPDGSPLVFRVNSQETVPVWIQTDSEVYIAAIHIPLSSCDKYITTRLKGTFYEPFQSDSSKEGFDNGWDVIEFSKVVPHKDRDGYTSQGILGFSDLFKKPNLHLHCEKQCLIADFSVQTSGQDSLKGQYLDVFIEGFDNPIGGINLSDTLGVKSFQYEVNFSKVYFLNTGDINDDSVIDNSDIEFLKNYFTGENEIPWPWQRADCNNDGLIDEQDLSYLENYCKDNRFSPE